MGSFRFSPQLGMLPMMDRCSTRGHHLGANKLRDRVRHLLGRSYFFGLRLNFPDPIAGDRLKCIEGDPDGKDDAERCRGCLKACGSQQGSEALDKEICVLKVPENGE